MNKKIVRNFSLMALMVGAMFVLNSSKAQAQNTQCLDQCYENYGYCAEGCGSIGGPTCFGVCQNQLNGCINQCNY